MPAKVITIAVVVAGIAILIFEWWHWTKRSDPRSLNAPKPCGLLPWPRFGTTCHKKMPLKVLCFQGLKAGCGGRI
jgi:hypothetical protein